MFQPVVAQKQLLVFGILSQPCLIFSSFCEYSLHNLSQKDALKLQDNFVCSVYDALSNVPLQVENPGCKSGPYKSLNKWN